MACKTTRKLAFGKKAKRTGWGLWNCSHGMYTGGYDYYVYGIEGIFNLTIYKRWGDFYNTERD
jgi:hypothetical protein